LHLPLVPEGGELQDRELAHGLEDAAKRLGFKLATATIEAKGLCAGWVMAGSGSL
jgi:Fe2+ or Zn2+ uptake regulation protein